MAFEEKRAWIMVVVTIASYASYLAEVLGRHGDGSLGQAPYVGALCWSVGVAIVASIVLHIVVSVLSPEGANVKDQRDREIHRFGVYVGQGFVVIGGVAGLLLAMGGFDRFWIANAIYLAFVLSALLSAGAKIVAYRWGFCPW
jgi:hypothetical protein